MNFGITFEKERKENFVATRVATILEDITGCDFLTEISTESYDKFGLLR